MSIATEITRLRNAKAALKESIEAKGVTVEDTAKLDEYPALVDTIPQGSGEVEEKDVNFYDYDGTCLYSYTKDEFLALGEMPALPDHTDEDLTNAEWNWPLSNAKDIVSEFTYLNIGATYNVPNIRLYIEVSADSLDFSLYLHSENGTIDWGDGNIEQMPTTLSIITHTYSSSGNYTINLITSKTIKSISGNTANLFGQLISNHNANGMKLKKCYIKYNTGGFNSLSYLFIGCCNLSTIILDKSISFISDYMLSNCWNLKSINIPKCDIYTKILLHSYCFNECHGLRTVSLGYGADAYFGDNCFYKCNLLTKITYNYSKSGIPGSVTSQSVKSNALSYTLISLFNISVSTQELTGSSVFLNCPCLKEIHFLNPLFNKISSSVFPYSNVTPLLKSLYFTATIPPTLQSVNVLSYIDNVYVPSSAVEDYKAATNWSNYADKIQAMPTT